MPNIIEILARAQSLMNETALNSITPPRAGGIMYDTLLVLNQMQLEGASLLISKVYASVSAMEADTTPTSDLTGRALKPGQLVVIVTSNTSSSDMGSEYRYNGPGSWTYVGKVGGLPLDTVPTQNSTKGITSGAVYTAIAAMKAEGYKYMGLATPGSGGTSPGTPNQPVFYIAGPGTYPNFGGLTVASGYLGFIKYSGGSWSVESVAVGKDYDEQISQLEAKVDDLSTGKYYGYFAKEEDLPEADVDGFAYVGEGPTYTIYNLRGGVWTSSDITVNQSPIGNDEDIDQNESGKLQFANRVYNAQQPNGMGYKILRKDATFASQVTDTNTIYEIRYDFVLAAGFTMPSGCILYFNGGTISGGFNFIGNNTKIESGKTNIFGTDITIAGTWDVAESFSVWFGAAGDGITDDTAAIKNCFLLKCPVSLNGSYAINDTVRAYNSVNGNGSTIIYGANYYLSFQDIADFYVKDINIDGQNLSSRGLDFRNVQNVTIQNCMVENIGNATIAQVFAINFAMGSGCKNINISACRIKNVVYDNLGACGGIGFSNNVNEPEATANNGLYVSDCRFEGFNTSTEDSDCIKVLSDNGLDTNVVITGCFFTGIGKRAIKTQARGVKLIGNTYEVITPVHAVVGFQRGYCESVNDTLIVNPSVEETSEYFIGNVFEVAVGGIGIYNFNTVLKNYVSVDGSHMRFLYITALGSSTFKGMTVANCRIGHSGYVMGFEATTLNVSDIDMHDITIDNPTGFVRRLSASTPTSLTNCKFEKIGILASYGPLVNLDFTKMFNCSFLLDANINTIGGTNITTDNGNNVIINFVDKSVSNVSRIEYSGGKIRTAYLYVDTNPAGLGSSKWGVLRSAIATIGTILIKSVPSVNGDGTVSMGYVLTSVSGSSVGTTIPYNVGTPSV